MSLLIASKKGKWIIGGVCVFALVATASTGLASWVIGQQQDGQGSGNITVVGTTDQSCKAVIDVASCDLAVKFGPSSNGNVIKMSGDVSEEDLTFKIAGHLEYTNGTYSTVKIVFDATNVASLISGGYIALPKEFSTDEGGNKYSTTLSVNSDETHSFLGTYSFKWGSLTGGNNPCSYFNGESGKGYTEAKKYLSVLAATEQRYAFNFTVSPMLAA